MRPQTFSVFHFLVIASFTLLIRPAAAQSVHQDQMAQIEAEEAARQDSILSGEIAFDPDVLESSGPLLLDETSQAPAFPNAAPLIDDRFIVFGYSQSYGGSGDYVDFYPWQSLTHVGSTFIVFDDTGDITNPSTWTNRDAALRSGGAAEAAGVKVIMVVLNSGFTVSVINTVMTTPAARSMLVDDIVALLAADGYSHGVSFDFEPFSWTSAARDGMTLFFQELRSDLNTAGLNDHEISIYGDPTPGSNQWDLPGFEPNVDYILYSCYDFATGSTPTAISRFLGSGIDYLTEVNDFYLDGGWPPEKMVMTISAYSRRWNNGTYGVSGATGATAQGFTDGRYDTTVNPNFGGPQTDNYVTDHQAGWHTWNDGTPRIRTWESPEAFEYEIRHVLSNQDLDSIHDGRPLGGVGFWSLIWMSELTSYDPIAASSAAKTRLYPHIFQLFEEILSPPGTRRYTITGFEGLNFRWRDPNEGPDDAGDTDLDSARAIVATPAGGPSGFQSTNAMQVTFDFENASGNRLFFRHEQLRSNAATGVNDTNAVIALFDSTTQVHTQLYTPASYAGRTVRMVVRDGNQQLETSPTFSLGTSGWREISWDLTAGVTGYTTAEPGFSSGNGTLNTAGGGEKDIAFVGWLIEGGAAGSGQVVFDEVQYEHANPGGQNYKINEFRYNGTAGEFVEIHGPAGAFPAGTQLRIFNSANGSVASTYALSGSIPGDGHWVIGDVGVPNVDSTSGFGGDDLPDGDPSGMQIYNTVTGCVYDSVIYEAFGGLDDLIRSSTLGVTDEGWPWLGETGPGTDSSGVAYTTGRMPDGADTDINSADFGVMVATPGTANGSGLTTPVTLNFTTAPSSAVQTFQSFAVSASGVGGSPSGGNVYRCLDTTGGGAMAFFGDAQLGAGTGINIQGEIYIPSGAEPAQAIGVGFCATQGDRFFSGANIDDASYENGYWLIYENAGGIGLNDGRPDHAGTFEFVHASNDNMDANRVDLLDSATTGTVGITPGAWTTFRLSINPPANPSEQLLAEINGVEIYRGVIPAGGPTVGAFAVGFRENHSGAPAANEGTWIDNIGFDTVNVVPVGLSLMGTN